MMSEIKGIPTVGAIVSLVEFGMYTNAGTGAGTWTIPSRTAEQVYNAPFCLCKNRGTGNVTINAADAAQFWVNQAAQASFILRPGQSCFIVSDGAYYYPLFSEEASTVQKFTPLTAVTLAVINTFSPIINIVIAPSATIASLNIPLPSNPFDGQIFNISAVQEITSVTLSGGTVLGAITSLSANGFAAYVYSATDLTWYRIG